MARERVLWRGGGAGGLGDDTHNFWIGLNSGSLSVYALFCALAWDDVPVWGKPDRGALEQAVLIGAEGVPAMQQEAVVPHDQVARAPVVAVDELGPGGVFDQFVEQGPAFSFVYAFDADHGRRVQVKCAGAGCRMGEHQRVGYVRRLRQDFFAGHTFVFVVLVPFGVAEDSAPAGDPRLGLLRECFVSEL